MLDNIIVIIVLVAIVACIVGYLIKAKKSGQTCIGCPYAKKCNGKCNGSCSHSRSEDDNNQ